MKFMFLQYNITIILLKKNPHLSCLFCYCVGLNNIFSGKVHDIHKYNVKIEGSDSKPVAYLDHLLDML